MHDAHNLCWKLALVLRGQAGDGLLDGYESERRPVAKRNVDWALFTWSNHSLTSAAIGFVPGDAARTRANFLALMAPTDDGAIRRARFAEPMQVHLSDWQAIDLDIGFHYERGALVPDDTECPPRDPGATSTRPPAGRTSTRHGGTWPGRTA